MPDVVLDVFNDSLVMGGSPVPSSGDSDRFRISFPVSAEFVDTNGGLLVESINPARSATLVITCYQTDPAHQVMLGLKARREAARAAGTPEPLPGSCSLVQQVPGVPRQVSWEGCSLQQQSEVASTRTAAVVTWTWQLSGAVRRGA